MSEFFKTIREADAARKAGELEHPFKIEIVEVAARKLSTILHSSLINAKLHTTTRRFIERESKLQDALFFTLERVLEVKSYAHYLKREELEVLKNTKVTTSEINKILEKLNTGLVVDHGILDTKILKLEEKLKEFGKLSKEELVKLDSYKNEKILISQVQEIVATYLATLEKDNTI